MKRGEEVEKEGGGQKKEKKKGGMRGRRPLIWFCSFTDRVGSGILQQKQKAAGREQIWVLRW